MNDIKSVMCGSGTIIFPVLPVLPAHAELDLCDCLGGTMQSQCPLV